MNSNDHNNNIKGIGKILTFIKWLKYEGTQRCFWFFFIFFNLNYRNDGVQRLLEHLVCTFSRSKQWIEQVALQSDLGSNTFVMPTYGLVRKHLFDVKPLIKKDQINKCDFKNHWNVLLCCFASNQISNSGLVYSLSWKIFRFTWHKILF